MRKLILALVLAAGSVTVTGVEASSTTISVAPASSVAGQKVTFTASFTSSCPGALTTYYFTIDDKAAYGTLAQSGTTGTDTLSTSALTAGSHSVWFYWAISGTNCRGSASVTYTVAAPPSPSPTPLPTAVPPPSPTPKPAPPPSTVTLVASKGSDSPIGGYIGAALIVLVVLSGVALMVVSRR